MMSRRWNRRRSSGVAAALLEVECADFASASLGRCKIKSRGKSSLGEKYRALISKMDQSSCAESLGSIKLASFIKNLVITIEVR